MVCKSRKCEHLFNTFSCFPDYYGFYNNIGTTLQTLRTFCAYVRLLNSYIATATDHSRKLGAVIPENLET